MYVTLRRMRKCFATLSLLTILLLAGCGSVGRALFPFWGSGSDTASVRIATPPFLLDGRAARHQDSLMERLQYLVSRPAPKELSLVRLEFRNAPDSVVQLVATYADDRRQNSHALTLEQIRARESERIAATRPLWIDARQAKLAHPVVVRAAYKAKDYLFQNSRMVDDTVEVLLSDSIAKPGR